MVYYSIIFMEVFINNEKTYQYNNRRKTGRGAPADRDRGEPQFVKRDRDLHPRGSILKVIQSIGVSPIFLNSSSFQLFPKL